MRSARAERAGRGPANAGEFQHDALVRDQDVFKAEATQLREQGKQERCEVHVKLSGMHGTPPGVPSPELYRHLFRVHRN
jgi:hypothetical protein